MREGENERGGEGERGRRRVLVRERLTAGQEAAEVAGEVGQ
jgi:hypothetical protein